MFLIWSGGGKFGQPLIWAYTAETIVRRTRRHQMYRFRRSAQKCRQTCRPTHICCVLSLNPQSILFVQLAMVYFACKRTMTCVTVPWPPCRWSWRGAPIRGVGGYIVLRQR
jgi:hypothetical protein